MTVTGDGRTQYDAMAADYVAYEGNPYNALYEQPGLRALLPRERVPSATFAVADLAEPLELEDDSFDLAVASLVMHYLRDWVPPLRELRRVLRPGGVFAFSTHHPVLDTEMSPSGDYFATEPQPLPECRERFPEEWERLTTRPHFLFLRLIRA